MSAWVQSTISPSGREGNVGGSQVKMLQRLVCYARKKSIRCLTSVPKSVETFRGCGLVLFLKDTNSLSSEWVLNGL